MNYRADIERCNGLFASGQEQDAVSMLEGVVHRIQEDDEATSAEVFFGKVTLGQMYWDVQRFDDALVQYRDLYDYCVMYLGLNSSNGSVRSVRDARDQLLARDDDERFERLFSLHLTRSLLTVLYGAPDMEEEYSEGLVIARFNGQLFVLDEQGAIDSRYIYDPAESVLGVSVGMTIAQAAKKLGLKYVIIGVEHDAEACYAVFYRGNYYIRVHCPSHHAESTFITLGRK